MQFGLARRCTGSGLWLTIGGLLLLVAHCSGDGETPADTLTTVPEVQATTAEPEASSGCNPPDLKFSRPRKVRTTTEPPYVTFETTQIYLPEDFTTADFEFIAEHVQADDNRGGSSLVASIPESGQHARRTAATSRFADYTQFWDEPNDEPMPAKVHANDDDDHDDEELRKRQAIKAKSIRHNGGGGRHAKRDAKRLHRAGNGGGHSHFEKRSVADDEDGGHADVGETSNGGRTRVKRKSGKTTGALSRPKSDSGSSSSKSISRNTKQGTGYDEDTGGGPFLVPDGEIDSVEPPEKEAGVDDSSEESQFREISEVRFPSETELGDRRICKIRCIKGKWVGPLCGTNEEVDEAGNIKFLPLYKSCHVNRIAPHLLLSYRNISVTVGWDLPHGHKLQARCRDLGLYKLLGESRVLCSNGVWAPRVPSCVPTTLLTNYSDDSPPSIRLKIGAGSGSFEPSGVYAVLPGSTLHLDCIYPRRRGTPEWTWTGWFRQYATGWSTMVEEKATKFRLTIKDIQNQDSGTYTCASPRGLTNSIVIVVAVSQCPQLVEPSAPLSLRLEGLKLGQQALYRCPLGYTIEGTVNSTCLASGNWSTPPPICHPVQCPPLLLDDPHLSLVELNTSAWGRAVFKCSWGYRLSGPPGLECEPGGMWSGPIPRCRAIQCPQPLVPINGRIDGTSGSNSYRRYAVGALVTFSCTEGHLLVGEASIVCTETGFWSHPPPFCKAQCPYPGDPPNGLIAPLKFHYDPGDTLSVQCRPGFVEYGPNGPPVRPQCLPDGNWSGPVTQCRNYEEV